MFAVPCYININRSFRYNMNKLSELTESAGDYYFLKHIDGMIDGVKKGSVYAKDCIGVIGNIVLAISGIIGLVLSLSSQDYMVYGIYYYIFRAIGTWFIIDVFINVWEKRYHMVCHHIITLFLFVCGLSEYFRYNQFQISLTIATHEVSGFLYSLHYFDRNDEFKKYMAWFSYFWLRCIVFPIMFITSLSGHSGENFMMSCLVLAPLMCFNIVCVFLKRKNIYNSILTYNRYLRLTQGYNPESVSTT